MDSLQKLAREEILKANLPEPERECMLAWVVNPLYAPAKGSTSYKLFLSGMTLIKPQKPLAVNRLFDERSRP